MKKLLSLLVLMYAAGSQNEDAGGAETADATEQQPLTGVRVGDVLNFGAALPVEMAKAKPGTFEPPHSADNTADVSTAATLPENADAALGAGDQHPTVNELMAQDVQERNAGVERPVEETKTEEPTATGTAKQAPATTEKTEAADAKEAKGSQKK